MTTLGFFVFMVLRLIDNLFKGGFRFQNILEVCRYGEVPFVISTGNNC